MDDPVAQPRQESLPLNGPASYHELLQTPKNDALVLSERETLALELWDQAEELRLEQALLEVQRSGHFADLPDVSDDVLDEQLITAEREFLMAQSRYLLRKKIIQSVLVTDPILKAVHGGENTSPAERRLLPMVNERDILAMIHGALACKTMSKTSDLSSTERENIEAMEKNQALAQELLVLANQSKSQRPEEVEDPEQRKELLSAQAEVRTARKHWRVMKSVVAGAIVGSGIDWANDEPLLRLVLDDEDELDTKTF